MANGFAEMFEAARVHRNAGRVSEAERGYASAAELARLQGDALALAHALRHLSDLAIERVSAAEALTAAAEAVAIYRSYPGHPLDLANALRLNALALRDGGRADDAKPLWHEARDLYESLGVAAGVSEADRNS